MAVYGFPRLIGLALCLACSLGQAQSLPAADPALVLEAKEALRLKQHKRLAAADAAAQAQGHPLAAWIDYWTIGLRLGEASQSEIDAFYARWPGTYVEDRLRNDWLLELGHRRDWKNFLVDHARYQMRDDREVACYWLLAQYSTDSLRVSNPREAALSAWLAQRDGDEGCQLLASQFFDAKKLQPADVWLKLRLSVAGQRPRAVKQAGALLGRSVEQALVEIQDNAGRYLSRKAKAGNRFQAELTTLALLKLAAAEPAQVAAALTSRWERQLPADLAAWTWAQTGRQAAFKLLPEAADYFERALKLHGDQSVQPAWPDETIAWAARTGLRSQRWPLVVQALTLLSNEEQRDPAWQYWRAQALLATAATGADGDAQRSAARAALQAQASALSFYGRLAAEDSGQALILPANPSALTGQERIQARANAGLSRALQLIAMGLRNEGVREWNFSLRGMNDRELLAAAQLACDLAVWDRCINTSERTRGEIAMTQRFPTPHRRELLARAHEIGIDPAYVYGLIRQESRFVVDAQSHVGAAGLMQVMPATARWTAKKIGVDYRPELMNDRDFNINIGTSYLKLVLNDFDGSMALAAAAYNAGPSRSRRWREGPLLDAAIWAENIPFNETRDYVKKVLTNTALYSQILGAEAGASLRARLGPRIGPRDANLKPTATENLP